jgi:hypothetical protein
MAQRVKVRLHEVAHMDVVADAGAVRCGVVGPKYVHLRAPAEPRAWPTMPTAMTLANASAIRRALENAGVELIEENGGGPGARLKQRLEFIDENGGGPAVRLRKPAKRKVCEINGSDA